MKKLVATASDQTNTVLKIVTGLAKVHFHVLKISNNSFFFLSFFSFLILETIFGNPVARGARQSRNLSYVPHITVPSLQILNLVLFSVQIWPQMFSLVVVRIKI